MIGIVGKKLGMTRIFTETGQSIPVTVVEVLPNRVTRLLEGKGGYRKVQVAWGVKKEKQVNKAQKGLFTKANVALAEGLIEYSLTEDESPEIGAEIKVNIFKEGQEIDATGITKGKGFAGVIKRYNFSSQRMTHGNSLSHRAPGSIGQCQTPGRVFKGKKMAGQLGNKRRTVQNLFIARVDSKRNLILIKGGVPATKSGKVVIKPAIKNKQTSSRQLGGEG